MAAALHDVAGVEHQDQVSVADSAQAVGDHDLGAGAAAQGLLQPPFGFGVEGAGGLIEDQD